MAGSAVKTHARYGDKTNMVQQAIGVFATHMQRNTMLNRLTGKMPSGNDSDNYRTRRGHRCKSF